MGTEAQPPERGAGALTRYFPVALDLRGRRCLVVGGGDVAARKIEALLGAGADVTVVAPDISAAIGRHHPITLERRPFAASDLDGTFLVVIATDDPATNQAVADESRRRRVLVNAADDPSNCDFILPAVVRRGEIQIAITTGGQSPALARHLRERLDREIPSEYGALAELLGLIRDELHRSGMRAPASAWQEAISEDALAALRTGDRDAVLESLRRTLIGRGTANQVEKHEDALDVPAGNREPSRGRIVLVGAGPGDPGLLTVAGDRAIREADVIVYDRLVNPVLLESARRGARVVYAGKSRGGGPMSQDEINELICAEAIAGNVVVRLKGGDPFVFGRGGEEALSAVDAGVPFTVIPGVSAAVAAPAYAGIPVTHRGLASSVTVLTGHEDPSKPSTAVDWDVLAHAGGTIVLLMGVDTLPGICARLLAAGLAATTPAAVIQEATRDSQRTITGTVADIADRARVSGIKAPATTVIGHVVELAPLLAWWQTACETVVESPPGG